MNEAIYRYLRNVFGVPDDFARRMAEKWDEKECGGFPETVGWAVMSFDLWADQPEGFDFWCELQYSVERLGVEGFHGFNLATV